MEKGVKDILKGLKFVEEKQFVLRRSSFSIIVREIKYDDHPLYEATLIGEHDGKTILKCTGPFLEDALDKLRMSFTDLMDNYRDIDDHLDDFIDDLDSFLGR